MTRKELIMGILEDMGYKPEYDSDHDIMFQFQMKTIFILTSDNEDDDAYVSVMLPQFNEVEEGQETLALAVCNKMTRELKMLKVYIDSTFKSINATCEFFYANEESLRMLIDRSLNVLGVARSIYRKNKEELSS